MSDKVKGKVIKYGDNVDTDVIIPARYLNTADPAELALHCMEDLDNDFHKKMSENSKNNFDGIVVGGRNFGCGSSREHAPIALKESGVSCVIASTFARIFYRNALNIGLAIVECPEASEKILDGDEVEVDFETGVINNITRGESYKGEAFPPFIRNIIEAGGLMKTL